MTVPPCQLHPGIVDTSPSVSGLKIIQFHVQDNPSMSWIIENPEVCKKKAFGGLLSEHDTLIVACRVESSRSRIS